MRNLKELENERIQMIDGKSIGECMDADMIIKYLNDYHSREVHFIDVYLNNDHLKRFDICNPSLIEEFYFSGIMCERHKNISIEKSNEIIKFILDDGKVFEFRASNQYYMSEEEAIEHISSKVRVESTDRETGKSESHPSEDRSTASISTTSRWPPGAVADRIKLVATGCNTNDTRHSSGPWTSCLASVAPEKQG